MRIVDRRRLARTLPLALLGVAVLAVLPGRAGAQAPPPEVRGELNGEGLGVARALDVYAPLLAAAPKDGVRVTKDVAYGKHPRQVLDVYPPEGTTGRPVMVFVHGGGYTSGERDVTEHVYGNIPTYFARNGFLGINADYRLAPEAPWPAGAEDVRGVVEWIRENAASYGGNPDSIFLFGHSAGATHVGTYVFDRRVQPPGGHGVRGAILMSGRYRVYWDLDDPRLAGPRAYFGADSTQYEARSITSHVPGSTVPVMLVVAENDTQTLVATTGELFTALCDRGGGWCPRLVQLKYHDHHSSYAHFNTADDYLGREILEWVDEGAARELRRRMRR